MRNLAETESVVPHFGGVTASGRLKPHSFIGVIPTHLESEFHQVILYLHRFQFARLFLSIIITGIVYVGINILLCH
jgi:hypothetical protein